MIHACAYGIAGTVSFQYVIGVYKYHNTQECVDLNMNTGSIQEKSYNTHENY